MGVGVVTKPGLGLELGGPAINPVPRAMITQAVGEAVDLDAKGVTVIISVPDGERMARKTTNARLGIIGGISILGTTGIVRPFSTASWRASVEQAISVLAAQGEDTVVLCTGGRTEKGAMKLLPQLPEVCFVEVGDFTGAALRKAAEHHLSQVVFAGMAGKLTKLAAGVLMTHYTRSKVDLALLADITRAAGGPEDLAAADSQRQHRPARGRTLGPGRPAPGGGPRAVRPRRPRAEPVLRRSGGPRTTDPQPSASSWSTSPASRRSPSAARMNVTVIGCDGRPFGPEATAALAEAERSSALLGTCGSLPATARRTIRAQAPGRGPRRPRPAREGPTAVLASGDPGFFGIVRALRARGITPHVIPAVSSVALAFARIGLDWDDALVLSAHGRDPRQALAAALAHPKAAILTAPGTAAGLAAGPARRGQARLRGRAPRHPRGEGQRPVRGNRPRRPQHPHQPRPSTSTTRPARRAGWPATRAPRTAGRCPRTRSSTATR